MPKAKQKAIRPNGRTAEDEKYFSKVVGKALDLLEILRAAAEPLSLNELTLRVEMMKSSVFRLIYTLERAGYVTRDAAGKYQLAQSARTLMPGSFGNRLLEEAVPPMKELSREFGETVSLAQLFENHIQVIAVIESPQLIRMANVVGRILQPHASSLGKTITAFQSEELRDVLLRSYGIYPYTEHTITDEVELKKEYEKIRRAGYGLDAEESILEGCCFGAPIFNHERRAVAAISISVPKMRLKTKEDRERIIAALRAKANAITDRLSAPARAEGRR